MASFASEIYEELKSAYTAVLEGISTGVTVVKYQIRGRLVERAPTQMLLATLWEQIQAAEQQINRESGSVFRVASISRAGIRGE